MGAVGGAEAALNRSTLSSSGFHIALALGVGAALIASGINPHDRLTWVLEVAPVLVALPLLCVSYPYFRFTTLVYVLMALHALILVTGGHWTYAEVPAGNWVAERFHLARNPFDRLGHFAQGFVPALIAREVLLRRTSLQRGAWLFFIVTCICLAISALYELIEWWAAVGLGQSAEAFLGTQGDVWDTQWDMFLALCGACIALLTLGRLQDHQMGKGCVSYHRR